ncbi:hypothetical protein, conserved [Leishmania tarentolae]|uniref:Uncharacterized protein n=1 Tax=Leishmania tarentolae TaxID=5689 RepID=A0A640KN99_LEITA|nr:hypothetical protein, conserved [Leishmania tarentolae]
MAEAAWWRSTFCWRTRCWWAIHSASLAAFSRKPLLKPSHATTIYEKLRNWLSVFGATFAAEEETDMAAVTVSRYAVWAWTYVFPNEENERREGMGGYMYQVGTARAHVFSVSAIHPNCLDNHRARVQSSEDDRVVMWQQRQASEVRQVGAAEDNTHTNTHRETEKGGRR